MPDEAMLKRQRVKKALFERNVTRVTIHVSGSGDSGWVDNIDYFMGDQLVLSDDVYGSSIPTNILKFKALDKSDLSDLEDFIYVSIAQRLVPGFENNDGGAVEVEWDIFNDIIKAEGHYYELVPCGETEAVY